MTLQDGKNEMNISYAQWMFCQLLGQIYGMRCTIYSQKISNKNLGVDISYKASNDLRKALEKAWNDRGNWSISFLEYEEKIFLQSMLKHSSCVKRVIDFFKSNNHIRVI